MNPNQRRLSGHYDDEALGGITSVPGQARYSALPERVYKLTYNQDSRKWEKKLDEKALKDFRFPLWSEIDSELPKRKPGGSFGNFIIEFERPGWANLLVPECPTGALALDSISYTSPGPAPTRNHFPNSLREKYSKALPDGFTPYLPGPGGQNPGRWGAFDVGRLLLPSRPWGSPASTELAVRGIKGNQIYPGEGDKAWVTPHCGEDGVLLIYQRDLEPEDFDSELPPSHDPDTDCDLYGDPNLGYGHPNPLALNIQFDYPVYSIRARVILSYDWSQDMTPYSTWEYPGESGSAFDKHEEEIKKTRTLVRDGNTVMFRRAPPLGVGGENE